MRQSTILASIGIFILRLGFGGFMLIAHGWPKLQAFSEKADTFHDPLGMGSKFSLIATIGAEVGCSILLILGLGTRFAALALAFTMGVAAFVFHQEDPWLDRELPILYFIGFLILISTGPGKLSMDHLWVGRKKSASK